MRQFVTHPLPLREEQSLHISADVRALNAALEVRSLLEIAGIQVQVRLCMDAPNVKIFFTVNEVIPETLVRNAVAGRLLSGELTAQLIAAAEERGVSVDL